MNGSLAEARFGRMQLWCVPGTSVGPPPFYLSNAYGVFHAIAGSELDTARRVVVTDGSHAISKANIKTPSRLLEIRVWWTWIRGMGLHL